MDKDEYDWLISIAVIFAIAIIIISVYYFSDDFWASMLKVLVGAILLAGLAGGVAALVNYCRSFKDNINS